MIFLKNIAICVFILALRAQGSRDFFEVESEDVSPAMFQMNVLGGPLNQCCKHPTTGWYRDGYCATGPQDAGIHTVCAVMTDEFLHFTKERGNDLSTPSPANDFPGLKRGDKWCLCAARWLEGIKHGYGTPVILDATHEKTMEIVPPHVLLASAA